MTTSVDAQRSKRKQRWKKLAIWGGVLLVLYTLFGFFGVPAIITRVVVPRVNERLNGTLTLANAKTNPFTFECVLEGIELNDARGVRTLACERFEGNLQTWPTIFTRGYHFERVILVKPYAHAEVLKDRTLNLAALVKPGAARTTPPEPIRSIPRTRIERLEIQEGGVLLRDESLARPFEASWEGLNVDITPLDWEPSHLNPLKLVGSTVRGERVELIAQVRSEPLRLTGDVTLTGLRLAEFMPYLEEYANGEVTEGTLRAEVNFDFAPTASPLAAMAHVKSAAVEGLRVRQRREGGEEFFTLAALTVTDAKADAAERVLTVGDITLTDSAVVVERGEDGRSNLERVAGPSTQEGRTTFVPYPIEAAREFVRSFVASRQREDPAQLTFPVERLLAAIRNILEDMSREWDVSFERIAARNSKVTWIDRAVPGGASFEISGANTTLGPIRRREAWRTPLEISATLGGSGSVAITGAVEPVTKQVGVKVALEKLDLAPLMAYELAGIADGWPALRVGDGELNLDGDASVAYGAERDLNLAWSGLVRVADLRVLSDQQEPVVAWKSLTVTGAPKATLHERGDALGDWSGTVEVTGLEMHAPFLKVHETSMDSARTEGAARLTLGESEVLVTYDGRTAVTGLAGEIADAEHVGAGELEAKGVAQATLGETSTRATYAGVVKGSGIEVRAPAFDLNRVALGRVALDGDATMESAASGESLTWRGAADTGEIAAEVGGVPVRVSGVESLAHSGDLTLALATDGKSDGHLSGDVRVKGVRLEITDPALTARGEATAELGEAEVKGIAAAFAEKRIGVDAVVASGVKVSAATTLIPPRGSEPTAAPAGRPPGVGVTLPVALKVGSLKSTGGSLRVTDHSGGSPVEISLDELGVEISGLDSTSSSPARVNIASVLNGTGKIGVTGTLGAFGETVGADLNVTIQTLPLKPFDPYAGRFVGYQVDSGRMTVAIPIRVTERRIEGNIDFLFDQLFLGASVPSEEAPNIPVKLGLALLRDSNNQVKGKVPFSGDMSEPKFTVVGLIWQAFFGLIGKAATAPFQLLGSLFSEGTDLSSVPFESGSAELSGEALGRIDALGKALADRPSLRLKVVAVETRELDRPGLKLAMLRETLSSGRVLSDAEYDAALAAAYRALLLDTNQPVPPAEQRIERRQAEAALIERIEVPNERFEALAKARVSKVIAALTGDSAVGADRIESGEASGGAPEMKAPGVVFELDAK